MRYKGVKRLQTKTQEMPLPPARVGAIKTNYDSNEAASSSSSSRIQSSDDSDRQNPDVRLALELLSGLGELRRDSVVSTLMRQLDRARQEEAAAKKKVAELRQRVEDLGIENEWLHSLCNCACAGGDQAPNTVDNEKTENKSSKAAKKRNKRITPSKVLSGGIVKKKGGKSRAKKQRS